MASGTPAAGYKFNNFQEIKSHSSILYNERMAILFYLLDMKSIRMNTDYDVNMIMEVKSILKQIYKNIRMLLRNNPTVRATLNLDTKDSGIYVTDVAFGMVDNMVQHCMVKGYSTKKAYIIVQELNKIESLIKDVLQYFHYFIRPDFRQKPDVETATEAYKEIADSKTVDQLKELVGKKHNIDFESLGSSRVDLRNEIQFDESVDAEEEEEPEEEEENESEQL